MRYVTIEKFANASGYTAKAIEKKIEMGVWIENQEFRRAPDGRLLVDVEGYEKWVAGQQALSSRGRVPSGSSSRATARAA